MRIWFDTPSARDLLFLEDAVWTASRRHEVLWTVSGDPAALAISKARSLTARRAGRYAAAEPPVPAGGGEGGGRASRLGTVVSRLESLARMASRFDPDLAVSVSSAEAARTAFGLGIAHVAFGIDEPVDDDLARMTAPLVQKMIISQHAPAAPLTRRGLAASDVLRFKGTAASATARRRPAAEGGAEEARDAILVRPPPRGGIEWVRETTEAVLKDRRAPPIAVVPRQGQARALKSLLGGNARIVSGGVRDGMLLLGACSAVVGAPGSTMAAEAALTGVPAVIYGEGGRRSADEPRLARSGLLARADSAAGLRAKVTALLSEDKAARAARRAGAKAEMSSSERPSTALARAARAAGARL